MRLKRALCAALERSLYGKRANPPDGSAALWNGFQRLSRARSCGGAGPDPIRFEAIEAWARLTRTPLEPHHVEIIEAMDALWLQHAYDRTPKAPEGVKTLPNASKERLTPALFDLGL